MDRTFCTFCSRSELIEKLREQLDRYTRRSESGESIGQIMDENERLRADLNIEKIRSKRLAEVQIELDVLRGERDAAIEKFRALRNIFNVFSENVREELLHE